MTTLDVFRRRGSELKPLARGANGFVCSEGETIVFHSTTEELPRLTFCGEALFPIALERGADGFSATFERLIDTWAGRSTFTLQAGEGGQSVQLDIGPSPGKLGPGEWDALITELAERSSNLPWGLSPGSAAGRMTPDALATVHPAIIEHELPILRRLLRQLLADPPTRTLRRRTVRPLDISRRMDLSTLRWLGRRPLELAGVRGLALTDQTPNARALAEQPESFSTLDHPMTRYIAHLLRRVRVRLEKTAVALAGPLRWSDDDAARTYARNLARQARDAMGAIDAVLRTPLFRQVRPEPLSDAVLQALPDQPLYCAIHRSGRRLINPGLAYAPGQDLFSALKHSYDLFELQTLYRLGDAIMAALGGDWRGAAEDALDPRPHEDRPRDGATVTWRRDLDAATLIYQPTFSAARQPPDLRPRTSLSSQRVPDFILIWTHAGAVRSWIILDAKYRSGREAIHEGLGDIHRYRDSLRLEGRSADGAYIIVPRLTAGAGLYGEPGFVSFHRLGALQLYQSGCFDPIADWLKG